MGLVPGSAKSVLHGDSLTDTLDHPSSVVGASLCLLPLYCLRSSIIHLAIVLKSGILVANVLAEVLNFPRGGRRTGCLKWVYSLAVFLLVLAVTVAA